MKNSFLGLLALALIPAYAFCATKTICGTRTGTSGNAYLEKNGRVTLVLAEQGGDQILLDQTDRLLGQVANDENGTQNGTKYCVNAKLSKSGKVLRIVGAYPEKSSIKTLCGVRTGTAGEAGLVAKDGQMIITLASQGGDQRLLEQTDSFLIDGTQNGGSYCVNVNQAKSGKVVKIVGAFEN